MRPEYQKPEATLILFTALQQLASANNAEENVAAQNDNVAIESMPVIDEGFEHW